MHWIVGDIHGMLKPLQRLLEAVREADPESRFCFTGDYVNRGPDSRGVIELMLSLNDARFLRGNHDDILQQILEGTSYCPNASDGNRLVAFEWFMQHGLGQTLQSYGANLAELHEIWNRPTLRRLENVLRLVPEAHRCFLHALEPVCEESDFFVAHGKWDADVPDINPSLAERLSMDIPKRQSLIWARFTHEEVIRTKPWRRTGYFGHTPVEIYPDLLPQEQYLPVRGPQIVLLDTGAALSHLGRLTAYCHETQKFLQASHFGHLVSLHPTDG